MKNKLLNFRHTREVAQKVKMKELAKKQGMITMVQDGLLKAIEGVTTVKEVFRVTE